MIDYINGLKKEIEIIKGKINTEENGFKVVDLKLELSELMYKINYCFDLVFKSFSKEKIEEFALEFIPAEKKMKADEEANNFNEIIIKNSIKNLEKRKMEIIRNIDKILKTNPNVESEEYSETNEYQEIKLLREDLVTVGNNINKTVEKTFFAFLPLEEKHLLLEKLMLSSEYNQETDEQLLKKVTEYISPLNLLYNPTYPLAKRFKELTENKTDSLAMYLLENEEHIKRLTVISNNDSISTFFDEKVTKIENQLAHKRYAEFNESAKENGIEDLINEVGQFRGKKVYYVEGNYERFSGWIKEIQTTDETKNKIKKLLHKFDSLDIIDEHADSGESKLKEYGFIKFIFAREEFVNAMNEDPANEERIKKALENLKSEEAKILQMYELIKEELGDDYESMPSNVDSYRTSIVPPCFKNNLSLNAKFNSLFIMLTFIKEKNLSIDDFVERPVEVSNNCIEESFQKCNLDNILKNKSKAEAILLLADGKDLPSFEDVTKYTRSFELIIKSEKNIEYTKNNHISSIAVCTRNGTISSAATVGEVYFSNKPLEIIQNILMAKKNEEGQIPYLDCYISLVSIQVDAKTNVPYDEKTTIVEKIKEDKDIENTFYEAINTLKEFTVKSNQNPNDESIIDPNQVFDAVVELATKIIVALDLKRTSDDQKRGYSERFVDDVYNIIVNYKEIETLKDLKFKMTKNRFNAIANVIENRDTLIKTFEKNMITHQKTKEEIFIREFERINKEIDVLDEQADKVAKKLEKGSTSQEIEAIALEQHKKFIELRNLQNKRLKELKEDVKKGMISKFYFEKRSEQVKLLSNIKDIPAMFMCDDKNYKNFKTYAKEVLKINTKGLSADQLRTAQSEYNLLFAKSVEDKDSHLVNSVLTENGLSINKSINYEKVEEIVVKDSTSEMIEISTQLLESNLKIKENKERIAVEVIVDNEKINVLEPIEEENTNISVKNK